MAVRTIDGVIQAWLAGVPARTKNQSLSTDGQNLYSYRLMIGYKNEQGPKVKNYRSPDFISQTTSCHVGAAIYGVKQSGSYTSFLETP